MKDYNLIKDVICLFDLYGCLLNDKQNSYMIDHFFKDLSLSEIAKKNTITKTAVSNAIKQTIQQLKFYEEKLKLVAKFNKIKAINLDHDCCIMQTVKKILEIL